MRRLFRPSNQSTHLHKGLRRRHWQRLSRRGARRPKTSLAVESLEQRNLLAAVPVLVDDLNETTRSAQVGLSGSATIGGVTYFSADDGVHGNELWRTDGTAAGTRMVKDINNSVNALGTPGDAHPNQLVNANGTLYFTARTADNRIALFKSDGQAVGTQEVTGLPSNLDVSSVAGLTAVADKVFFAAREKGSSAYRLWVTDSAGTRQLTDPQSPAGVIHSNLRFSLYNVNGKLIFFGNNGSSGIELWSSDGTFANTVQVTNLNPSNSFVNIYNGVTDKLLVKDAANGDRLYFAGYAANSSTSLWVTDGTLAGTMPLASTVPSQMASVGSKIYFQAYSSDTVSSLGYELWVSDGTPAGTHVVADIAPGLASSYPQSIVGVGETAYFLARSSNSAPFTYWRTEGTTVEPVSLPDFPGQFTRVGASLFFSAVDPVYGRELFNIDAAGTIAPVLDIAPGAASSSPNDLKEVNGKLMFTASRGTAARALWISGGDIATTSLVKDINQSTEGAFTSSPVELGGKAYFSYQEGGGELFVTDGTAAGTMQVTNIRPGSQSAFIDHITRVGDALFFTAFDSSGQRNLWKFDGTAAELVFDEVEPGQLRGFQGRLYFSGASRTVVGKVDLWTSDGTTEGTRKLSFNAKLGTYPRFLGEIGGELYFQGDDGNGEALWRGDAFLERGGQIESVAVQPDGKLIVTGRAGGSLSIMRYHPDGTLDTSFGQDGRVLSEVHGGWGGAVIQADGKIVVGGARLVPDIGLSSHFQAAVVRLMPNGSYDTSFGTNGIAFVNFPGVNDGVTSLALQDVGGEQRIVFSTDPIETAGNWNMAVVRLDASGNLDTSFGGDADADGIPDGFTITDVAGLSDYPSTLLVSPVDQKILLAGSVETSAGVYVSSLLRYSADGILDVNYGSGGSVSIPGVGTQFETALVLPDGSVLAGGDGGPAYPQYAAVIKVDPQGNLDSTFGDAGTGIVLVNSGGVAEGIVQLPDGSFAVSSRNWGVSLPPAAVFRLTATGQLDTTFGDSGIATTYFGEQFAQALTLSVQPDPANGQPKLVVAGQGYTGSTWRWGMARFDLSGTLDSSFGDAGNLSIGVGTRKFSDDLVGTGITQTSQPVVSGGNLYFTASHPTLGYQLWVQSGGVGTPLPLTSTVTLGPASVGNLVDVNGTLLFHVTRGTGGEIHELWKSDGTVLGTAQVAVIEDSEYAYVNGTASVGGSYYFTVARYIPIGEGGFGARELWLSDGTPAGTKVIDTAAVPSDYWGGDLIGQLVTSGGKLYYQKHDAATGFELLSHDGLTSTLARDFTPGPRSSYPFVYDVAGETFIRATTPELGSELWHMLDDSNPATQPVVTLVEGAAGVVTIARSNDDLVVTEGGVELARYALGSIIGLSVQGATESDVIMVTIDGLSSAVLPGGITIAAGEGVGDNDTLILSGSITVSNYNYTTGGPESGTITLDGLTVTFSEFEPIIDSLNVVNRSFQIGTTGDQQVILEADGQSTLLSDGGTGAFESLSFASPSGSFHVAMGDGDDTVIVRDLSPTFAAELSVDGGDGNDSLDAGQYDLPVQLSGGAGDDILVGGTSNDTLEGGEGNDQLDGGAGADAVDGGTGTNSVVTDVDDGSVTVSEDDAFDLVAIFVNPVSATIDWGDGTPVAQAVVDPSAGTVSGSHVFPYEGNYVVTVSAVDSTGAVTTKTLQVTVTDLVPGDGQVFFNSLGILRIGGTPADDQILVAPINGSPYLSVTVNGNVKRNDIRVEDVTEIRVWGQDGNDVIHLVDLAIRAMLDGGAGDDELQGGAGNDLLFGRAGQDTLVGGAGDDFLIGGWGADRLIGSQGHDILVADEVDAVFSEDDLRALSAEWAAGNAVDESWTEEVENEEALASEFDRLTGGSGSDWFIVGVLDRITDYRASKKDEDRITFI